MENLPLANIPFEHLSPIWFVLIAIVANAFPPVPEEIFLLYFGYLANIRPDIISFWQINFFLIIGFLLIDSLVYHLALKGHKVIHFILKKILDVDLDEKEEFLNKHIYKIIFISRFLVQLRALGPITAARLKLPFKNFLKMDFLALVVYVPTVMGIGYYFAHSVEKIFSGTKVINNIMFSGVIILISLIILKRLRKILLSEFKGETNHIKSFLKM
jgi:membrane-associated protein